MKRIPALWIAAYRTGGSRSTRAIARVAVHLAAFVRKLALADHNSFTSL